MPRRRSLLLTIGFSALSLWLLQLDAGCSKEYSYEARNDSATHADSQVAPAVDPNSVFPSCRGCAVVEKSNEWSCQAGSAIFCGEIDTAIINKERTAFTFFGPSKCSSDSGLIISAYLQEPGLDRDRQNLSTSKLAFYYYDKVVGGYMLMSQTQEPMQLTISSYNHQTRKATGTFKGFAYTRSGHEVYIHGGKFSTILK